jgi:hypothetical protein
MHACFTPPSSSIGQLSPTRKDEDSESSWPDDVQTRTLGSNHERRCELPMRLKAPYKRFNGHRSLSPSSDVTSDSSEDELCALPGLPPSKNVSYYVQRAKRRFNPYDRRRSYEPSAVELRFFHKSVGKCSGETDMTLADVQAVS